MKIYLVRHGEIKSNKQKVYAGWSAESITEESVVQIQEAGKYLASKGVEAIYSSPLNRAVQTARIIKDITKVPFKIENDLIELRMGPWEGKSETEIECAYRNEWHIWSTRPADLVLPGRETLQELQQRVLRVFDKIKKSHLLPVVLVTHVALIRVALLYIRGCELNAYKKIYVPNAEPFEVDI